MGEPAVPWPVVRALVDLTERSLAIGLDAALVELGGRIEHATGVAVQISVAELGYRAEVSGVDADTARAVTDAVASAQRAVAVHASEAAQVDELRELARLDDLTGVLNRRAFFERLDDELSRARRTTSPVTLVLCDLDGFKAINDAYGHPAGDVALRSFAALLETNLRASDSVGRIGGDEFALILIGADASDADGILARLAVSLEGGAATLGQVRASFGTARAPADGTARDELVAAADRRLYEAKRRQT